MKRYLQFAEDSLEAGWERIKGSTFIPEETTSWIRVVFGLFMLVAIVPSYSWIAGVPQGWFHPPFLSIAALFDGFPPVWILKTYDIVAVLLLFGVIVGLKARWCGVTSVALYIIFSSFGYSFGKIDHSLLPWVALLCFSFSNWGSFGAILPDKPMRFHRASVGLLAIVIAFGFFTAGFPKALVWIDLDLSTSGAMSWYYSGYFNIGRDYYLASHVLNVPSLAIEIGEYGAILFELTGILFLIKGRKWWCSWLLFACTFHMMNLLFLNINFIVHAVVYLPFFFSRSDSITTRASIRDLSGVLPLVTATASILAISQIYVRLSGSEISNLATAIAVEGGMEQLHFELIFTLIVWVGLIITGAVSLILYPSRSESFNIAHVENLPDPNTNSASL